MSGRVLPKALASAVLGLAVLTAGWVSYRAGGGGDLKSAPPGLAAADAGSAIAKAGSRGGREGYQAELRLVDMMKDARFDAPNAGVAQRVLGAHWRKMPPPWSPRPVGDAGKLLTSIALRTSASETQWAMPAGSGKAWTPDARVWNMNEGSFDQRDAIVAPTPATISFKLDLPAGARLTFAAGTVNATSEATLFNVSATDARGQNRDLCTLRLAPKDARRWTEGSCDLSELAGQTVDLKLTTQTAAASDEEHRAPRRAAPRRNADAGADEAVPEGPPGVSVALWGNPTLLGKGPTRAPYNVLFIVVDALRPDVLASFHDDREDAKSLEAKYPPLEGLLPKVVGLTPVLDGLAARGVRFTHAYSGGAWTRPGTLAMLAGARSSELGIETLPWVLPDAEVSRFYSSDPPLLPLLLRRQGMVTRAFVNNYFMVGYAPVGVDMGFERVDDHRYRTRDTLEVTAHATEWIRANAQQRFFLFCNYNSPHEPWEPPARFVERVPPPPAGPKDGIARLYMAEAAKDDEAIGQLLQTLDETGTADHTIVVVTADHGETLSSAHSGTGLDKMAVRYHHAVSNYEETTRVPILIALPNVLPAGLEVKARVRSIDIAPTLLDLLGFEPNAKMSGRSLVPLTRGVVEADARVVVSEGRGTRGIISGKYRLLTREGAARTTFIGDHAVTASDELYDLDEDPGERHDLAPQKPDLVAEMRARLDAALKNVPAAGTQAAVSAPDPTERPPAVHVRFAGGRSPRKVSGTLTVGKDAHFTLAAVGVGAEAFRTVGSKVELSLVTAPDGLVGFDLVLDPPNAGVAWDLMLDEQPWPTGLAFGGPFGLAAPSLRAGITTDEARAAAYSKALPEIDPTRDVGLFVTRERRGEAGAPGREVTGEGSEEMSRLLQEWGYAHGSGGGKK